MQTVRPYVTIEWYCNEKKPFAVPIYLNKRLVKKARLSHIQPKRVIKYAVTFADDTATLVDKGTRLYFDVR